MTPAFWRLALTFAACTLAMSKSCEDASAWKPIPWEAQLATASVQYRNLNPVPAAVEPFTQFAMVRGSDAILGSYCNYPYPPDRGLRVMLRISAANWIEVYRPGRITKYLTIGRGIVDGEYGTVLLRLRRLEPDPKRDQYVPQEAFLPDSDGTSKWGHVRNFRNRAWTDWYTVCLINFVY
jgi:hypothetical protein